MSADEKKRLRPWKIAAGVTLVVVVALAAWPVLHDRAVEAEVARLTAELDRNDPGWQPDEIRVTVQPDVAYLTLEEAIQATLDSGRVRAPSLPPPFIDEPTGDVVTAEVAQALRGFLATNLADVTVARGLADVASGRPVADFLRDHPKLTRLASRTNADLAALLRADALHSALCNRGDEALHSVRAALRVGTAEDDEPDLDSAKRRAECGELAARMCERVLSMCEPSAAAMATLAATFRAEDADTFYRRAVRAERGRIFATMRPMKTEGRRVGHALGGLAGWEEWEDANLGVVVRRRAIAETPALLRYGTAWLAVADLTDHEQAAAEAELIAERERLSRVLRYASSLLKEPTVGPDVRRAKAAMRAAVVALAAERYRRAEGAWPASAGALLPRYLDAVPRDPCHDAAIRLDVSVTGVEISSSTGWLFRLWNPSARAGLRPESLTMPRAER